MSMFEICKIEDSKYNYIIFSTSYQNPLSDLETFSKEMANKITGEKFVLIDLMLSNGNSFNRFVECFFNGKTVIRDSIKIKEDVPDSILNYCSSYYKQCKRNLGNSTLTSKEIGLICI